MERIILKDNVAVELPKSQIVGQSEIIDYLFETHGEKHIDMSQDAFGVIFGGDPIPRDLQKLRKLLADIDKFCIKSRGKPQQIIDKFGAAAGRLSYDEFCKLDLNLGEVSMIVGYTPFLFLDNYITAEAKEYPNIFANMISKSVKNHERTESILGIVCGKIFKRFTTIDIEDTDNIHIFAPDIIVSNDARIDLTNAPISCTGGIFLHDINCWLNYHVRNISGSPFVDENIIQEYDVINRTSRDFDSRKIQEFPGKYTIIPHQYGNIIRINNDIIAMKFPGYCERLEVIKQNGKFYIVAMRKNIDVYTIEGNNITHLKQFKPRSTIVSSVVWDNQIIIGSVDGIIEIFDVLNEKSISVIATKWECANHLQIIYLRKRPFLYAYSEIQLQSKIWDLAIPGINFTTDHATEHSLMAVLVRKMKSSFRIDLLFKNRLEIIHL